MGDAAATTGRGRFGTAALLARVRRLRLPRRRRAVPPILQVEAVECGAVALAMVLAHHGAWLPLERLRTLCGVSRDGSRASNILNAARSLGLAAKGYRKEPAGLADLPWPLIVHWNFNHYVVLEGLTRTHAFVCDPAHGARTLTLREFGESFTGVALAFEPTAALRRTRRPPGLARALAERARRSKAALVFVGLVSVLVIVPGVVLPVFAKMFVDGVVVRQQEHWLVPLLLLFALTAVVRALLTLLRGSVMLRLEAKLTAVGASRFVWHVLRLPVGFFLQRSAGEIAERVASSGRVAQAIARDLPDLAIDAGTAAAFLAILIGTDVPVGLAAVALAVPYVAAMPLLQHRLADDSRTQSADVGKLVGATAGLVANIETTRGGGLEQRAFAAWAGHHAKTLESVRRVAATSLAVATAPVVFAGLAEVAVLGLGVARVMAGALTVGDLVAIAIILRAFAAPLGRVFARGPALAAVAADLHRVDDALRNPADPLVPAAPTDTAAPPLRLAGAMRLDRVSFGYNPLAPPLLDGIDLAIAPGGRVAFVGRSGCGKSTLGRLMCGLLRPAAGEVLIDGARLDALAQRDRAANIAYVDQDVVLFEGTVRDNLTLWRPDVSDSALTRALDDAALLGEIAARPGGLDAAVEEGGRNFSGGQRQRLEIARALVGDPAVLILDEATAALDPETERLIDERLRRRGCTTIIIAHRLSTIRDAGEIVLLADGRIAERGTHEALMDQAGEYAALVRAV